MGTRVGIVIAVCVSGAACLTYPHYVGEVNLLIPYGTPEFQLEANGQIHIPPEFEKEYRMWYAAVMGVSPDRVGFLYHHMAFGEGD